MHYVSSQGLPFQPLSPSTRKARNHETVRSKLGVCTESKRVPVNTESIASFLRRLANESGEELSHSDEHHLPFQYKLEVYVIFEQEYPTLYQGDDVPSF